MTCLNSFQISPDAALKLKRCKLHSAVMRAHNGAVSLTRLSFGPKALDVMISYLASFLWAF
jgi:hypothetical protein